jgi:hypothetical protein
MRQSVIFILFLRISGLQVVFVPIWYSPLHSTCIVNYIEEMGLIDPYGEFELEFVEIGLREGELFYPIGGSQFSMPVIMHSKLKLETDDKLATKLTTLYTSKKSPFARHLNSFSCTSGHL